MPVLEPAFDLDALRARVPLTGSRVLMNACSRGAQTLAARAAADAYLESWGRDGMDWEAWVAEVEAARAAFGAVVSARAGDVAVSTSLSAVASSVASALDFPEERPVIVSSEAEFPTVAHVWLAQERRGARVRQVEAPAGTVDVGAYVGAIDERTRIVSIPLGLYLTGHMPDVAPVVERARAVGALVFCDAYQVAGARPVDAPALGVDVLAAGCVKYLLGTAGIAFAYVRPEVWASMEPAVTGWFGRSEPFAYDPRRLDWADGARRLDTGTPPILPAYVARAAMDELRALGMARVGEWTAALAAATRTGAAGRGLSVLAAPRPGAPHTPTTSVLCNDVPGGSAGVEISLRERGVLASARGPVIRLSPHAYNTLEEVDLALDALADLLIGAPRGASPTPPA